MGQESEDAGPKWKESRSTYIRERSTTARNGGKRRRLPPVAQQLPPTIERSPCIRMFSYCYVLNDAHFGTFAFKNETFPDVVILGALCTRFWARLTQACALLGSSAQCG